MSVNQFVDAIKGDPVKGYGHVEVKKPYRRKINQDNNGQAAVWFGEMAAGLLASEPFTNPILVPFPNSKCAIGTPVSRTKVLADSIVKAGYTAEIADILRFTEALPSANRENGSRDPKVIYPKLVIVGTIRKLRTYVVVDDVLTSGGHVRAGVTALKKAGANVRLVVCAVSAEQTPSPAPFERVRRELEDFEP
jgi:hypothetical protein